MNPIPSYLGLSNKLNPEINKDYPPKSFSNKILGALAIGLLLGKSDAHLFDNEENKIPFPPNLHPLLNPTYGPHYPALFGCYQQQCGDKVYHDSYKDGYKENILPFPETQSGNSLLSTSENGGPIAVFETVEDETVEEEKIDFDTPDARYTAAVNQEPLPLIVPYIKKTLSLVPVYNAPGSRFPLNFSAFVFNGIGMINYGEKGCNLQYPEEYQNCPEVIEKIYQIAEKQFSKDEFNERINDPIAFQNKGTPLSIPLNRKMQKVHLGLNPEIHANYKKALEYVEEKFLNQFCFFQQESEEIIHFLKKVHQLLLQNLPISVDNLVKAGEYRSADIIVFKDENIERDRESLIAYLEANGASSQEINTFTKSLGKFNPTNVDYKKELTQLEKKVWNTIAYFPPSSDKIEFLMHEFIANLKELAQKDTHPVALAAWAHSELGRIHAFEDGNGRLARLLLNAILVRGGYEPVIFFDEEAYTKATSLDDAQPGAFATYLVKIIKEQSYGSKKHLLIRA